MFGEQRFEVALQPPGPPAGAVTVGRWVEDDAVVPPFATDLAGDERPCVVDQPADRSIGEAVERRVAAGPGHRRSGGIDVHDLGAGACQGQRAQAGVGEEIQDRWPVVFRDPLEKPRQRRGLLREEPDLAGIGGPELHREIVDADRPAVASLVEAVTAPASLAIEPEIGVRPLAWRPTREPGAGRGPVDEVIAEALETPAVARVDQFETLHGSIITETDERPNPKHNMGAEGGTCGSPIDPDLAAGRSRGTRRLHEPIRWRWWRRQ